MTFAKEIYHISISSVYADKKLPEKKLVIDFITYLRPQKNPLPMMNDL